MKWIVHKFGGTSLSDAERYRGAAEILLSMLTEAEFDLSGWDSPYARVLVRDNAGRKAWTNPIWF